MLFTFFLVVSEYAGGLCFQSGIILDLSGGNLPAAGYFPFRQPGVVKEKDGLYHGIIASTDGNPPNENGHDNGSFRRERGLVELETTVTTMTPSSRDLLTKKKKKKAK